ncbi:hypothetical protein ACI2KR_27080 [Pseudomonas luteola]
MDNEVREVLPRRNWCYMQAPAIFGMAPCACGSEKTTWSEFEKHLWCDSCKIDFIPQHSGIFDGPILIKTAMLMGISFDRFNLATRTVEKFNPDTLEYEAAK